MKKNKILRRIPEVVGIGESIVDLVGGLPNMPKEDSKVEFHSMHLQIGGPAALTLLTLSRLGIQTAYFGTITEDYFGKYITRTFKHGNVLVSGALKDPVGTTPLHIVISTKGGRTIFKGKGNLSPLVLRQKHYEMVKNAKVLFIDRHCGKAGLDLAKYAYAKNVPIVLDPSSGFTGELKEILSYASIVIVPQEYVSTRFNKKSLYAGLQRIWEVKKHMAVVTLGKRGCIGKGPTGKVVELGSVAPCLIDSNGAGDVFRGAFIYGLLQKWNFQRICKFANTQAGLKCARMGL